MYRAFRTLFTGGLVGKLLGVVRELMLASLFGTGTIAAAFRVAQTSILVPINFFTADVLNAAVIPLFRRTLGEGRRSSGELASVLQLAFGLFALILAVAAFCMADWFVFVLAPGLDGATANQAAVFVRVLAMGVPPYVMSGLFSYLEMANGSYSLASARASIQSIGLIMGILCAVWQHQAVYVALGFTGAYWLIWVWGCVVLHRYGLVFAPRHIHVNTLVGVMAETWSIVRPLAPLPFVLQGNVIAERLVASYMGVSLVAAVDYAKFITESGLILLAVPLGLAGLSTMSGSSRAGIDAQLQRMVPPILILTIPVSSVLFFHSHAIVQVLYERGAFSAESTRLTETILSGLALGFWAQILAYVLTKVLNAELRNSEVLRFTVVSVLVNLLLNLCLGRLYGPVVLGLSVSVSAIVLLVLVCRALQLQHLVTATLAWLSIGVVGYIPTTFLFTADGLSNFVGSMSVSACYWLLFVRFTPRLHAATAPLTTKRLWRTA